MFSFVIGKIRLINHQTKLPIEGRWWYQKKKKKRENSFLFSYSFNAIWHQHDDEIKEKMYMQLTATINETKQFINRINKKHMCIF